MNKNCFYKKCVYCKYENKCFDENEQYKENITNLKKLKNQNCNNATHQKLIFNFS